ncbi:MAG: DUF401 family protein [Peptococcaceae bacterium]
MTILFKILIVFFLILWLTSKKLALGFSLFIGSVVLGILFKFKYQVWKELFKTFVDYSMWELTITFLVIGIFAVVMNSSGLLDKIIDQFYKITNNVHIIAAFIPFIIGMVNIPGGAFISAPFIDKVAQAGLTKEEKSTINILFRHLWYPIYPIFPALILVQELTAISMNKIILLGLPSVVISLISSWIICFGIRSISIQNPLKKIKNIKNAKNITEFFLLLLPLFSMIFLVVFFKVNTIISIIAAILLVLLIFGGDSICFNDLINGINWKVLLIPIGIYSFRQAINLSGVINDLVGVFNDTDFTPIIPALFFAIIVAFITGYHLTSVGLTVPLFMPLMTQQNYDVAVFIMFMGALFGYWISPIHSCVVLSNEYFGTTYLNTFKKFIFPAVISLIVAIFTSFIVSS